MKKLRVFWRNSPDDLKVLQVVDHVRFGADGEEVITTDAGAQTIVAMSREFAEDFWLEDVMGVDPHSAADLLCQSVSKKEVPPLLRQLITVVSKEDQEAASALFEDFEDTLRAQG
ncbi:MAG: hypothetical protein HY686_06125 [Chloroflexi bacterium]|nr:hypothetical protein [Chloroflexota bacterium]